MLFKNKSGNYIEVLRNQFTNDTAYYKAIMNAKGCDDLTKTKTKVNELDRIMSIVKRT
jgi:hypothetical protein